MPDTVADPIADARADLQARHIRPDAEALAPLLAAHAPDAVARARAERDAADLVRAIRTGARPGMMEVFLAEYGLSTEEGIALMCLAEALLRVPDAATMDDLIEDKIAPSEWGRHLGHSASPMVNASTWALMLTGRVLKEDTRPGLAATLHGAVKRLGEPVIRAAVGRAMREMGNQFVLGETIAAAQSRAQRMAAKHYTHSYDMLGEAARTADDATAYLEAYRTAIAAIAPRCKAAFVHDNPGISIKLSALHPRYEAPKRARLMDELVPRVTALARAARAANMGLSIDAEEADRLEISLDVIEAVLADPELAGWDGFGVVVQAYGKRAPAVLDWLSALADRLDRRLAVRLVKGAYWDAEIKRAQVEGLEGFPVYAHKAATDVAYVCCARKLLDAPRLYPQFATHNAHTVAAILAMGADPGAYEFQRLHGMGEALHETLRTRHGTRHRIYAPVGAHRDLLAYLVRRLLENGANSSFVNRIVDETIPPEAVAPCPFSEWERVAGTPPPGVTPPAGIFGPGRRNSRGWDLRDDVTLAAIDSARAPFRTATWETAPILAGDTTPATGWDVTNPAAPDDAVGTVRAASAGDVETALSSARIWDAAPAIRAETLRRAADLYEARHGEFFALMAREAGKTLPDAVAELREAVDFLRYYAGFASDAAPRGTVTAISPWNFPLAIFTGQIAAALAAGNAVLAKPAEATTLTAALAARLLHQAGVPRAALQLLPGTGADVGARLTADARVAGAVFTGSTATAQAIHRSLADHMPPQAPLVAETGGLNAMIVDSTALPEQAVRDVIASAFQSAGQRCSAARILYVQRDVADRTLSMLKGAMDELAAGDPWDIATDLGPVISAEAQADIRAHVEAARADGRLIHETPVPATGHFVPPTLIRVGGIADLAREVFGPVLHVATYAADELDAVVDAINARGYGLTLGLHTRIDDRVSRVASRARVGNLYVNRNQIGAVVGAQPFGGEGLSGTGPKAGGPAYVPRFRAPRATPTAQAAEAVARADPAEVQRLIDAAQMRPGLLSTEVLPGPTGESNRLSVHPRGVVLCLGPSTAAADNQAEAARAAGCAAVVVAPGTEGASSCAARLAPKALATLAGIALVAFDGPEAEARALRQALAARPGPILALARGSEVAALATLERHLCIDTTASGGNATLLAAASGVPGAAA